MSIKTAFYEGKDINLAVEQFKKEFTGTDAQVVIYFFSSNFDAQSMAKAMQDSFAPAITFGCTTSGEIVTGKMLKNAIVAMALPKSIIKDVKFAVVENLSDDGDVEGAFGVFEKHFAVNVAQMDPSKYIGLILTDGLSGREEWLLDKVGNLTDVPFVGGSAGDDLKFTQTYVCVNGKAYSGASVLLLMESGSPFDIVKTQSFRVLDKVLTATKVNEESREVVEFNGKPAVAAYAEAVGCAVADVEKYFMTNPIGLVIDDEPFVRSPQKIAGESMIFYCNVMDGMEYHVLAATDLIAETKKAIEDKRNELGTLSAVLNFNCILRSLQLYAEKKDEAYGAIFKDVPTLGFSTYGEAYLGHINQTATMVVWK